jgi:hypothetical protein
MLALAMPLLEEIIFLLAGQRKTYAASVRAGACRSA